MERRGGLDTVVETDYIAVVSVSVCTDVRSRVCAVSARAEFVCVRTCACI